MSNLHLAWARAFFAGLADAGVRRVVMSPGSRSTPLVLGATAEPRLSLEVCIDERSAGFYALGQARATGEPSVLVCTSGTAAGHYLPAVMEASEAHLPLVVVTADRPWEAQGIGAPQTLDQVKLYGGFVRRFVELGLPDVKALSAPLRVAAQAVSAARGAPPGPVHVNAHFRKPLEPVDAPSPEPWERELAALLARGAPRVHRAPAGVSDEGADELAARIAEASRPVFAFGPAHATGSSRIASSARRLAEATHATLLLDATSQLRFGASLDGCHAVGAVLGTSDARARLAPDLLVEVGLPPTDSAYAAYAEESGATRIVVAPWGYPDALGSASALHLGEPSELLDALTRRLVAHRPRSEATELRRAFLRAESGARDGVRDELAGSGLTEGLVVHTVAAGLPAGALLMVGNSLAIRDLDLYAAPREDAVAVLHQRGVNGIDGLVSGFAGAVSVGTKAAALLLGDVSFAHDLGGLALLRAVRSQAIVVVIDNGGGRIFEELPLGRRAELGDVVERCFLTPPRVDFTHAAAAFGLAVEVSETRADFERAWAEALVAACPKILVARVAPGGRARRSALRERARRALFEGASS